MFLAVTLAAALAAGVASPPQQSTNSATASPPGTQLSLADVLSRVRSRSPQIEAARARQRASVQARGLIPLSPNPSIEFRGENFGSGAATGLRRDVFATATQPIELGGKRSARLAEAAALIDVTSAGVTLAEWMHTFTAAEVYLDAVRAREVMAALDAQRNSVSELVALLDERVGEGVTPEADLRKFETEQTRLASQVTRASVALRSALLRLSALVGSDVQAEQLQTPVVAALATNADSLSTVAIGNRPDVQIAAARVERAEAAADLERALGSPDLAVTAGYKRTEGIDTAVAGVTMAVPLFNRNRVALAYASGELHAARLELQQVREQAVADAQARWTTARELGAHAERIERELLGPAAVVRSAARSAFVEGRGDILQLVDAERVFGEASREALELRLDATLAVISARLSIGEAPLP